MTSITILKLNPLGQETWRYPGRLVEQHTDRLIVEAFFDRQDMEFFGMPLLRGDRFIETYFCDRWYNIFEIHDRQQDTLRGWYCNVATPARLEGSFISYMDLALDLLVFPDGKQLVLDEDEFARLEIDDDTRARALDALAALQSSFTEKFAA